VSSRAAADPANVAVVCLRFLRYGSSQAVGLRETGLNVTLYYLDRRTDFAVSEEDRALLLAQAQAAGVEVVAVPRPRFQTFLKDTIWLHRDMRRRSIATAVIQSHKDARFAALGLAVPVALILHDPQPHSGDTPVAHAAPRRAMARVAELTSACLIVHSERLFEQIRPLLRRVPIGVVPHGADMAPSPAPIPPERRLLVFGRLFAYKGVDTALDAFRLLPAEMADVKLIVAGRGPLGELAVGQRNVEVRNEYIPESEVDGLLGHVRLVLLPYKDATQSGVGLQAVGRGVPCIVSSAGGLPDLLPDALPRLVVPPDDPASLAEAIVAYVDHDDALRREIYDYVATNFDWPVVGQRLLSEVARLVPR
jgi:glycosyltransferase involved in cell wall biosynthesis